MVLHFKNQHAIITGGSSGIGKATALLLASQGSRVTLIARNAERLNAARAEIVGACAECDPLVEVISADVSDRAQAEQSVHEAIARSGAPDMVITSAGMVQPGLFSELPIESFEQTTALNYLGTVYVVKAALPSMMARKRGNVVLISSGAGLIGLYGYTSYSPTKFALHGLGQALRTELRPSGIHVMVVYPPDTDTPQLAEENLTKPKATKRISGTVKVMRAEQVAGAIVSGIRHHRHTITPGLEMSILAHLGSLAEPLLNLYMDVMVRVAQRDAS